MHCQRCGQKMPASDARADIVIDDDGCPDCGCHDIHPRRVVLCSPCARKAGWFFQWLFWAVTVSVVVLAVLSMLVH